MISPKYECDCPRCGQDRVVLSFHKGLDASIYHCPECDAVWLTEAALFGPRAAVIGEGFEQYTEYMESRGIEPTWDHLLNAQW